MLMSKKSEFTLPPDHHYLDCAYMSPLSRRVQDAGRDGILRKAMPWNIEPADFFSNLLSAR